MRRRWIPLHPVLLLVIAQIAWLALLGLWIEWFVSKESLIEIARNGLGFLPVPRSVDVSTFVLGIVFLGALLIGISLFFISLSRQLNITRTYDNFIASVTHELKSPLASIQLHLETLRIRALSATRRREFVDLMSKDANRLGGLIDAILSLSVLEQKRVAPVSQVYEADDLFRSLLRESKEQFRLPDEAFTVHGALSGECFADRSALKIVLNNIIDNAMKYNCRALKLSVSLGERPGNRLGIDLSDNGIGIGLHDRKKIFRKFYRAYDPDSPNMKGTGLGLYWAREIVRRHGGRITAASRGAGFGSTFSIELPRRVPRRGE